MSEMVATLLRLDGCRPHRQAKEKAEHKSPLKVHILRSYKQILADKMAHPTGSKSKLKALAEAKLRKAKVSNLLLLFYSFERSRLTFVLDAHMQRHTHTH